LQLFKIEDSTKDLGSYNIPIYIVNTTK